MRLQLPSLNEAIITTIVVVLTVAFVAFPVYAAVPEANMTQTGQYRVLVGEVTLEGGHSTYRKALERAINESFKCQCETYVVMPAITVNTVHPVDGPVIPPVEPPIDPPPVDPPIDPPTDPPPLDAGVAYYSYSTAAGALVDPLPLEGAVLIPATVYISWGGEYTNARHWCCKTITTPHTARPEGRILEVDFLVETPDNGVRELWSDIFLADGTYSGKGVNFTVHYGELPDPPDLPDPPVVPDPPESGPILVLQWEIPTQRENGDALPASHLLGYTLYRHQGETFPPDVLSWGWKLDVGNITEYEMPDLPAGRYWFSVAAKAKCWGVEVSINDFYTCSSKPTEPMDAMIEVMP